jgi:radical SAM protein with 4Fe4S-binding SPASM domain
VTEQGAPQLRTCVWELTLACNARCLHCGSTAGVARPAELDTEEGLALIAALAALGCRSVTLSGGEPLLRRDWPVLAAAIVRSGMSLEMISNGLLLEERADDVAAAAFSAVTVSVDGTAAIHDHLRGAAGSLARLWRGIEALRRRGVRIGAVTQINRLNVELLEEIHRELLDHGVEGWQLQLTVALGRAVRELCLTPDALPALEERMAALVQDSRLFVQAADSLGYLGRHEPIIRSGTGQAGQFWTGCQAGLQVIGITSDGGVRGCLSLPPVFDEGNLRQRSLAEIWGDPRAFAYNRRFHRAELGGPCASCAFGELCRAGCKSLAYAATGGLAENPYCVARVAGRIDGRAGVSR